MSSTIFLQDKFKKQNADIRLSILNPHKKAVKCALVRRRMQMQVLISNDLLCFQKYGSPMEETKWDRWQAKLLL
jgi:hypothetical protein